MQAALYKFIILTLLLSFHSVSLARVFNFKNESIAPYFRATGGLSRVGNEAFVHAKGTVDSLDDEESAYNYSGEFGVVLHFHETLNFRLAAEVLQSQKVSGVKGSDAGGAELYTLESETFIFHPNLAVEVLHKQSETFRLFTYYGMGQGSLSLDNDFRMTAAGEAGLVPSYKEKLESTSISYFGGVGVESLLTDATTIQLDVGYRHLVFNEIKHKGPVTTNQGSFNEGDQAINDNQTKRRLDFSGFYLGLSFRFFIEII